jgi:hypothetical protein
MTERALHAHGRAEYLFDDTEGLPTGEQNPEDETDILDTFFQWNWKVSTVWLKNYA